MCILLASSLPSLAYFYGIFHISKYYKIYGNTLDIIKNFIGKFFSFTSLQFRKFILTMKTVAADDWSLRMATLNWVAFSFLRLETLKNFLAITVNWAWNCFVKAKCRNRYWLLQATPPSSLSQCPKNLQKIATMLCLKHSSAPIKTNYFKNYMLQAGRLRIRFPMSLDFFFNWLNPSSSTMALGSTQPLTEMRTRNLPVGKGRKARKADLAVICESIV
jgi:hypothetical protein